MNQNSNDFSLLYWLSAQFALAGRELWDWLSPTQDHFGVNVFN
jgi:hypothetical protein